MGIIEPDTSPRISDMAQGRPSLEDGLNAAQLDAVRTLAGPVLVLAGAGTGKTKVLTTRIAHILRQGLARPWEILCVTFTNKAAREMKERCAKLIGAEAQDLSHLGTFHSIAALILRRHGELIGLKSSFAILDDDDQLRVIKQIFDSEGIDQKKWLPKSFAWQLDQWKNKGLTPRDLKAGQAGTDFANGKGLSLYQAYQARLMSLNACDFGDLLLHNLTLFRDHADLLATYHKRFRYILVDEYQDTNVAQYLWLRLLTNSDRNLCCVGDDDQSIYGWRGAEIDNILRFEKDYPGAKIVRLEQTYRSTTHILAAASHLITANAGRLGKTLWTAADGGEKVRVRGLWDGAAEAQFIVDDMERAKKSGRSYADMAILVRASFQMRAFEERLVMERIPYIVIGGPRFFERAEIRDALAYLRLIQSQADDLAFERIVNVPKRGIGESTVSKLLQIGRMHGQSLVGAAKAVIDTDEFPARARTPLTAFLRDLDRWVAASKTVKHPELLNQVLTESGYLDMHRADKTAGEGRLENLKELMAAMQAFDDLGAFLEHVSLVMELESEAGGDCVRLMTLHAAKGLEFPYVYLPGWEEGVFPSQRAIDEFGLRALEEERRLGYVGITRARENALISFVANRQVYGRWTSQLPSRFVDELPHDHVEAQSATGYSGPSFGGSTRTASPQVASRWDRDPGLASPRPTRPVQMGAPHRATPPPPPPSKGLKVGERVFHIKFGYGVIVSQEGNKLSVNFESSGEKKVIDSFVDRA